MCSCPTIPCIVKEVRNQQNAEHKSIVWVDQGSYSCIMQALRIMYSCLILTRERRKMPSLPKLLENSKTHEWKENSMKVSWKVETQCEITSDCERMTLCTCYSVAVKNLLKFLLNWVTSSAFCLRSSSELLPRKKKLTKLSFIFIAALWRTTKRNDSPSFIFFGVWVYAHYYPLTFSFPHKNKTETL